MTLTISVTPYCERKPGSLPDLPADGYVAGIRSGDDATIVFEVSLPAPLVELAVLEGSRLCAVLEADGRVALDAEALSDEAMEAANAASCAGGRQTLETLVARCLEAELLTGDDDVVEDLMKLRAQIARALENVDSAIEGLKRG